MEERVVEVRGGKCEAGIVEEEVKRPSFSAFRI
jgi:hypothetical protein